MRIVAGQYRGKKLCPPENNAVRPTSERTREAVFNILNSHLGKDYSTYFLLDIFAGTGAFGFEGLSRGMAGVTFVDINTKYVKKNAALFLKETQKIKIINADATHLPLSSQQYQIVFCDAPYEKNLTTKALEQLAQKNWLADKALCIVETKNDESLVLGENFEIVDERKYGLARVSFLIYTQKKY